MHSTAFFRSIALCFALVPQLRADTDVYLRDVPDYGWFGGAMGTACGNLIGYWDRHGLPGFYTGPTGNGLAPLNSNGTNFGITSVWASKAGIDGRSTTNHGHIDDYWAVYLVPGGQSSYQDTGPDPYLVAHRPEHAPDCIGDFIGLSQRKWTNMNNECDGNLDGLSFVYWDLSGNARTNFVPGPGAGAPARDVQSGLRDWTRSCGYDADVFTQLVEFNPNVPAGRGFTFNDLKAEIDAGFPVLLFLQSFTQNSRAMPPGSATGMPRANPASHAVLAHGYYIADDGTLMVHNRTSFSDDPRNENRIRTLNVPIRGAIAYHPKPKITSVTRANGNVTLTWDGPASELYDNITGITTPVHRYTVERAPALNQPFAAIGSPTTDHSATISDCCGTSAFFRVSLITP